ncbi:cytochrome C oxidase subunit IV family protein [Gynurincola endophyticus]|jgi:cytochrome c oxidase subunit 4|uniref:cytochrome C oxidase subunit IV family protein n=1 Tax=Gynurincola endophyticus TaxID=2479004 RepID=UPI000F8C9B7E|nr:cytochrome C oxidase subunit IV family protein [Gynurincola endophyticus]
MAHTHTQAHDDHGSSTKHIWRTFWILLVLTVVELVFAIVHDQTHVFNKYFLNFIFAALTLAKAYYIVAEFMHLKHENKNFIMTIVMSFLLIIWAIIALIADGNSYGNLKNTYDPFYYEKSTTPLKPGELPAHGEGAIH